MTTAVHGREETATAILYCGQESPYGQAHLEPLLKSRFFDVQEVVLGSLDRWETFRRSLAGTAQASSASARLGFRLRQARLERHIKRLKRDCTIRVVHDVNAADEVARAREVDFLVSAAYPQIFKQGLLAAPQRMAINFHPSYLPRCRGAHPVYWTIASGEAFGGVTCHVMTEALDQGPIVAQRRIDFEPETVTYAQLYRAVELETPRLCRDVEKALCEKCDPAPQEGKASAFRNDRDIHRRAFFAHETARQLSAKVRAGRAFAFQSSQHFDLLPPVAVVDHPIQVTNAFEARIPDGTVVATSPGRLLVKTAEGFLDVGYRPQGGRWRGGRPPRVGEILT